ncbi:hypothetical protein Ddye_019397 [Dipteronia dyeriana]|uniref:At1g61320/AtMIF1 LRR domain-containing protein n=1 Tax=Dipteronia dyeriana TaxID=168575 RepID=A0AAD9TY89_9ROSI|nr:hypothetical protein Ddye_019397 [Dipteronia dyeriana]
MDTPERPPKKIVKREYRRQPRLPRNFNINLPEDALDRIISFLPVKIGMRTSILSTRFQHSWKNSRILDFDQREMERSIFIKEVDRVFDLHFGPIIQTFRLNFIQIGVESYAQKWIEKSVEKKVEEVELNFLDAAVQFELSPEFFNIESLRMVKLNHCAVDLPPLLKGSTFLKTLVLKGTAQVSAAFIETISKHCRSLEVLEITRCRGFSKLKILAENHKNFKVFKIGDCYDVADIEIVSPTLRSFHYHGKLILINISMAYQLEDVLFILSPTRQYIQFPLARGFLSDIVHVTVLTTTAVFIEEATTNAFSDMNLVMRNLRELQLFMQGSKFCNIYDLTCVLTNCPNLEKLFIDMNGFSFEGGHYWVEHHKQLFELYNVPMIKLRLIKIKGFKHQHHEMEMVKCLLQAATSLETLILVTAKSYRATARTLNLGTLESIPHSWKSSPNAEIKMYHADRSRIDPTHRAKTWFR